MRPLQLQWQSEQPIRGQRPKTQTQDPGGTAGFAPKCSACACAWLYCLYWLVVKLASSSSSSPERIKCPGWSGSEGQTRVAGGGFPRAEAKAKVCAVAAATGGCHDCAQGTGVFSAEASLCLAVQDGLFDAKLVLQPAFVASCALLFGRATFELKARCLPREEVYMTLDST
jgi:hypothetical protein